MTPSQPDPVEAGTTIKVRPREELGGPAAQSPSSSPDHTSEALAAPPPIAMVGVLFDKITLSGTLRRVATMIASRQPHYIATANVDFVVQAMEDLELRRILSDSDLVLCDGMPLVWASRFLGNPLPERVAGSDLVPALLAEAERQSWRVYFLGGTPESVAKAAEKVRAQHPRLELVGAYSPPFKPLLEMDHDDMVRRIREARPDILLVAFGCPKQEKWISMQFRRTGVPVSIGVGATIDFLAGSVRRAPIWMQGSGLEWVFRLLQEPRRLFRRYFMDLWFFGGAILRQWWQLRSIRGQARKTNAILVAATHNDSMEVVRFPSRIDAAAVEEHVHLWPRLAAGTAHLLLDLSGVSFIDSTGVGLLVRLQKQLREGGRQLVLVAPAPPVLQALALMRFTEFFPRATDLATARDLVHARVGETNVLPTLNLAPGEEPLAWQGDIVAANEQNVWRITMMQLELANHRKTGVSVNLAGVRFIDSTGVGLMVRIRKAARERDIPLRFTDPQAAVLNVLRILRMESYLLG